MSVGNYMFDFGAALTTIPGMLRINPIADADAAAEYYQQSDYYLEVPGEWIGKGAERLGLKGRARQEDFEAVFNNRNPVTGESLTAKTIDNRRVGWDFNFNSGKSVGIARELIGAFDPVEGQKIEDAHREAVAYAMSHVEDDMLCRVRTQGRKEDRATGNMIAMRVTHRTTRPNEDDRTPDMELHDHVVVANATFDDVEGKCKAAEIAQIWHDATYYEAIYHNRLAASLRALGYGIRRKGKGFEIEGITDEMIELFSRRKKTIEKALTQHPCYQPQSSGHDFAEEAKGEMLSLKKGRQSRETARIRSDFVAPDRNAKSPMVP